jgi:hypothetical protein
MRAKDATILDFLGDSFQGGLLGAYLNIIILFVGVCGVIQVFTKKQVLRGLWEGYLRVLLRGIS